MNGRSIEDILKAKVASEGNGNNEEAVASDAESADHSQEAVEESPNAVEQAIAPESKETGPQNFDELYHTKNKLLFIRMVLEQEGHERASAQQAKTVAESVIEASAVALEEHGISKEELLSNPEYADVREVMQFHAASSHEGLYTNEPSVSTPELRLKLEQCGVTLPEAELSDEDVIEVIDGKIQEYDEKSEAIVADVLSRSPLTYESLFSNSQLQDVPFSRLSENLERLNHRLPSEMRTSPLLREAVITAFLKETILKNDATFVNKRKEYDELLAEEQAFVEAKEKLPEYVEYLNNTLFKPLFDAVSKLPYEVRYKLIQDGLGTLHSTFKIDEAGERYEITEFTGNSLPTVAEMNHLMKNGESLTNYGFAITELAQAIEALEVTSQNEYIDLKQKGDRKMQFTSTMPQVLERLMSQIKPKQEVSSARYSADTYETFDALFVQTEHEAEETARQFVEFDTLQYELKHSPEARAESELSRVEEDMKTLKRLSEELQTHIDDEFRVENGRLRNVTEAEQRDQIYKERELAIEEQKKLTKELSELGSLPEGLFVKQKQERWKTEQARITAAQKENQDHQEKLSKQYGAINENWSYKFDVPPRLFESSEGAVFSGEELKVLLMNNINNMSKQIETLRPQVVVSKEKERVHTMLRNQQLRQTRSFQLENRSFK